MKTLTIILLSFTSLIASAQKRNGLSIIHAPQYAGFGLRYDYRFPGYYQHSNDWGYYVSADYGAYKWGRTTSINHLKVSGGIVYYTDSYGSNIQNLFFSGMNIHTYSGVNNDLGKRATYPVTFDLGTGVVIKKRLQIGFGYDFLKRDANVFLGWRF